MPLAEFKEKTIEQYLTNELCSSLNLFFAPDQVFEGELGFDVALHSQHIFISKLFNINGIGHKLEPGWWSLDASLLDAFPPFKCNILIQYKRPFKATTRRGKYWSEWGQEYFYLNLTEHQNNELNRLAILCKEKILVLYAAPSFYTRSELWLYRSQKKLVENTNFCEAKFCKNHDAYSYISPGNVGKGHSDIQNIESTPFLRLISETNFNDGQSNREFIIESSFVIRDCLKEMGLYRGLEEYTDRMQREFNDFTFALNTMNYIKSLFDVEWYLTY